MTADKRTSDRKQIDAMTRDFLEKGGKIVQCPPGASEEVVYKKNTFRRRAKPAGDAAPAAPAGEAAPATPAGEAAPATPAGEAAPAAPEAKSEG
ncbi:hypothetical protein [Arenibaculum sp.]|jgi:hypothetical protein|uniref:hypothetical protein n=1 Tax=Arenibaculum sp. TaxID=2865862 RepID=UPI002E0F5D93|nr:hypothetical protein [Arenibaculum sp.]